MIQLNPDYLLVDTASDQMIPCLPEAIAVELVGAGGCGIDPALVEQAAAAVLHYFRHDLGWSTVSVGEFARALEQALHGLGFAPTAAGVQSVDLRELTTGGSLQGIELTFFPKLRQILRSRMLMPTEQVQFYGLRACVKQLTGAKRWGPRCQSLNDQIVTFLRACFEHESVDRKCDLVIR